MDNKVAKSAVEKVYVPFTLDEIHNFTLEQVIARGREYLGADWTPSWMTKQERQVHA